MTRRSSWAERLIGQRVGGRYHVERLVGEGGMGAVLAAVHVGTGRHVALKVVSADDPERGDRLAVEARAAGSVDHPCVVDVFDCGHDEESGVFYLAQRLLRGYDLRDMLAAEGPVSPRDAVELLVPVMGALVEIHRNGIVHRDLKLENLFLARDRSGGQRVMLLDFGIAKVVGATDGLTRAGDVVGSPLNMSPEQAYGRPVGAQSDVWAMATVFFELITGQPAFQGADITATLLAVTTGPVPRLDAARPGVSKAFADVIAKAMERDLTKRYPSMAAFLEAVLECDMSDDETVDVRTCAIEGRKNSTFSEGPSAWPVALTDQKTVPRIPRAMQCDAVADG